MKRRKIGEGESADYLNLLSTCTLKAIAQFDEDGLWHTGEIGFSRYGTLMNTIVHLISFCDSGKSCSELEKQQRVYVQNALLTLVKTKKLSRQVVNGVYVYVSTDPDQSHKQIQNRFVQEKTAPLPDWVVMQVLVATIKCISGHVKEEAVALLLRKQGSSVTLDQVQRVFKLYSLEKKRRISRRKIAEYLAESTDPRAKFVKPFSHMPYN